MIMIPSMSISNLWARSVAPNPESAWPVPTTSVTSVLSTCSLSI